MDDIRRVLGAASKRLFLIDLLRTLVITSTAALVMMTLARAGQKLVPYELPWAWVLPGGVALSVIAALGWSLARRARGLELARQVDQRAGLRESISTALCVQGENTPWSSVVVEQAGERARRVVVRDAIPIEPPRVWPATLAALLALAIVWWLPSYDVTGLLAKKQAAEDEAREIRQVMGEVKASQKKIEDLLANTSVDLDEDADDEAEDQSELDAPTKADEVRRAAIKKLTKLSDKIKSAQQGAQSQKLESLRQSLRKLREPGEGPMTEFARQLARGNFSDAKEQLREMSEQLSAGELDAEQAKMLKKQLENLARQMEKLAQSREQLEQKLQEAGLSEEQAKQAAQSPSKMSEMLENMPSISSEMMSQLQQLAQAQQNASESMQSMSQAMSQMAQSMSEQSMSQEGAQSMESLAEQLSSMEMAQGEMEALESAMSEIQSQMEQMGQGMGECASCGGDCSGECSGGQGQGDWAQGDAAQQSEGSGGPGQGYGESPSEQAVDYILDKKKQKVLNQGGPTIGSTLVFGDQVRGESVAQFEGAVTRGRAEAAEAIETKRIPREYEDAVQHYFGRLEARAKARRAAESGKNADPDG